MAVGTQMLSFEMGRAAAQHYLHGTWLGRAAMLTWLWPTLIVVTLQGQEPHATGIRWFLIVADLIACGVIAWVVASLPAYLIAGKHRKKTAPSSTDPVVVPPAARPALPRLSR